MPEATTVLKLGVDTTDVRTAADELDHLAAAGKRAESTAKGLGDSIAKVDAAAASTSKAVGAVSAATAEAAAAITQTQGAAATLGASLAQVGGQLGATGAQSAKLAVDLDQVGTTLGAASTNAKALSTAFASIDTSSLDRLGTSLGFSAAASKSADELGAALMRQSVSAEILGEKIGKISGRVNAVGQEMTTAAASAKTLSVDLEKVGTSLGATGFRSVAELERVGTSLGAAAAGAKTLASAVSSIDTTALERAGTSLGIAAEATKAVDTLGEAVTKQAGAASAAAAGNERAAAALRAVQTAAVQAQVAQAAVAKATQQAASAASELAAVQGRAGATQQQIAEAAVKAQVAQAALASSTLRLAQVQEQGAAAQRAYQAALGKTGEAMKLTAFQSTQLGFQLNDFFVQVASGQSPLTALIQQGSQLSGTFGGFGNTMRALGTVFTPVRLALGGVVGAIAAVGLAANAGADESIAFARSMQLTGNAAGLTEERFNQMAESVAEATNTSIGSARETLQSLASSGQLSGATLEKVFAAVQTGSRATGQSTAEMAQQFVGALDNVGGFAEKLNKTYNFLSAEQIKLIRETADNGDAQKALGMVMDALSPKFQSAVDQAGLLERAYIKIVNVASSVVDALKSIGRAASPATQLANIEAQIEAARGTGAEFGGLGESGIAELEREASALREQIALKDKLAAASAESARSERAKSEFQELQNRNLSKEQRLKKEIAEANAKADAAGVSGTEREQLIKRIEDRYKDLGRSTKTVKSSFDDLSKSFDDQLQSMRARLDAGGELTKSQELEIRLAQQLADKTKTLSASETERLQIKARELVSVQKSLEAQAIETKAAEQIANARVEARRAEEKSIADFEAAQQQARDSAVASARDRLASLKAEEEAIKVAKDLNLSLAEAVEMVAMARLEERRARVSDGSKDAEAIDKEIAARRELLAIMGSRAAREATEKAAQEAAEAWQKTIDQAGQSLADSLMQGGRSAREYIIGLFRSLTLRPIIQAVVQPLVGAASSLLPGAAAASGIAQSGVALGSLSNVAQLFTSSVSSSLGSVFASAGNLFGSSALSSFGAGLKGSSLAAGLAGPTTAGAGGAAGFGSLVSSALPFIAGAVALFSAKDALFGRKLKDTSIEGTFGGEGGFSADATKFFKGGLFRSDKTERTALDPSITAPIKQAVDVVKAQVSGYAEALGLPVDAIASFTQAIKFSTKGLTDDQIKAELEKALKGFSEGLADTLAASVDPFAKAGETTGQTLERLSVSLSAVNPVLDQIGLSLFEVGAAGGDAASQLAALFGGIEGLQQAAAVYFDRYFTEAEKAAKATQQVTDTLADVGLAVPATREEFRKLVEAQDLNTEAGRQSFSALLSVAQAFDELQTASGEVSTSIADTTESMRKLEDAVRANIGKFQTPEQRQQSAFQDIADDLADVGVEVSIDDLLAATKEQIFEFAKAFVEAADHSDEAKTAVVNAAGALADLKDAAEAAAAASKEAAEQLQRDLEAAIDANIDRFLTPEEQINRKAGKISADLAAVGVDIDVDTLLNATNEQIFEFAKAFVLSAENSTQAKIAVVEAAGALYDLNEAALESARAFQQAIADYRQGALAGAIEEERLRQLKPAERVKALRAKEARLFEELETSNDPVAVAEKLQQTILDRIQEEVSLREDANDQARDALEAQIDGAKRLKDLSDDIAQFTGELRFSDLSPLSAKDQVRAAEALFEATLAGAKAGDESAVSNLLGNAKAFLDEAASAFASGPAYAEIFGRVTSELEALGLTGSQADPQIELWESQLAELSDIAQTNTDMLDALLSIDAALGGRMGLVAQPDSIDSASTVPAQTTIDTSSPDVSPTTTAEAAQREAMTEQLRVVATNTAALAEVVAGQSRQIAVDQEGYLRMIARLEAIEAAQVSTLNEIRIGRVPA